MEQIEEYKRYLGDTLTKYYRSEGVATTVLQNAQNKFNELFPKNTSAPIPKELDALAEKDWNENDYSTVKYKGQDKARHHRIFRQGYIEPLKSHSFNDEDMRNAFRHTSYMSKDGINLLDFDKWLEQYKASKTVI